MTLTRSDIRPVDLRSSSDETYAALTQFFNLMRREWQPDDPPMPLEERTAGWRSIPAREEIRSWAVWDGPQIIAYADVGFDREEHTNDHLVGFEVSVHPDHRRQGIARALLHHVVRVPEQQGRRLMIAWTSARIPAGEAFMERLGASKGLVMRENQLLMDELDHQLMARWIANAPSDEFELGFWDGAYPEEDLPAICRLMDVMNSAPRDDLEVNDHQSTPEEMRDWEKSMQATGTVRWTAYVRERATGKFAGFTATGWHANRPENLGQWGTGVNPEFRGKGLGRWLKAAMLERVVRERPSVRRVRTGNAYSNQWMLAINDEMGFKPYSANTTWQVETARVLEYLR
jgi:GNAT superfamily N-acetyltransferase